MVKYELINLSIEDLLAAFTRRGYHDLAVYHKCFVGFHDGCARYAVSLWPSAPDALVHAKVYVREDELVAEFD